MEVLLSHFGLTNPTQDEINLCKNSDTDYHNKPIPVLLQPVIAQNLINKIEDYNIENGTNFGLNISSLLSLVQLKKNKNKDPKYKEQFQLDINSHGTEYLKKIFNSIISDDPMVPCIMEEIENTQSHYGNRKSEIGNPKLFLMFLPMGNDIDKLQNTIIKFLEKHKMWTDYHICKSNSKSNSDGDEKEYKKMVDKEVEKAKSEGKKGCILLLGNQGKMAYTYHNCDVVIRLDNSIDIDDAEQVSYRCLTEGPITDKEDEQKTIGITVDLNIQRVYAVMRNKIKNYKKNNPNSTKKYYCDIIQYMCEENQFIFNPHEFNFGNCTDEMIEYFKKYEDKLKSETLIDTVICNIQCEDTLCDIIKQIKLKDGTYHINDKLNGKQPDCSKGDKTKKKGDPIKQDEPEINPDEPDEPEIDIFNDINKTKNLFEFLTKLCCLMLRIDYKNPNITKNVIDLLKTLKENEKRFNIIKMKLIDDYDISEKDLNIIYDRYIIDMDNQNNIDILDDIFEIYSNSDPKVVRDIIGKHFIPSLDQKKKNAEIPTPPKLCDEMIDKIPRKYFMNKNNKTFEPCCGKGNFVLALFERYFDGLTNIEDECERCIHIIEKCLYFCDIDPMNIYITEELLKCHALSKMKEECWKDWGNVIKICDVKFNSFVGNTLELIIQDKWDIEGFDAVIGNPPYQKNYNNKNGRVGGSSLWSVFINNLFKIINKNGLLLFITPCSWMTGGTNKQSGNILKGIFHKNTILYLDIEKCSKYFNVASTFSYYLIKKSFEDIDFECETYYKKILYKSTINQCIFRKLLIIPKLFTNETINIINKVENKNNNKFNFERNYELDIRRIERFTENGIYNIRHKVVDIKKSNYLQEGCMNKHKLIISMPGYIKPLYDYECGCTDATLYHITKNKIEAEYLITLLNSPLYKFIINNYRELTGLNNHKNINRLCICPINDTEIYKYFNLTDVEIKLIENIV